KQTSPRSFSAAAATLMGELAETRILPSLEKLRLWIGWVAPFRTAFSFPVWGSHNLIKYSSLSIPLAVASSVPSGVKAMARTSPPQVSVCRETPAATSQTSTLLSLLPEARSFPFGEKATRETWPPCPCRVGPIFHVDGTGPCSFGGATTGANASGTWLLGC